MIQKCLDKFVLHEFPNLKRWRLGRLVCLFCCYQMCPECPEKAPMHTHTHTHIYIYIHIHIHVCIRKVRCQVPSFPRFWKCSVFATSCSILYVHIPVMVLLEIHTDCQTPSEVAKECPESHEDSQGKGRRKNKHSVCVYIYIWLPLEGEVAKEKTFFFWAYPPPS